MPRTRHHDTTTSFGAVALTAIMFAGASVGIAVVARASNQHNTWVPYSPTVTWCGVVAFLVTGVLTVGRLAEVTSRVMTRRTSAASGAIVRLVVSGAGYLVCLFSVFFILGVSPEHLFIGAGLAGVILAVAAQQSLGNIFASLVLILARPFSVGEHVRVRSGTVGVLEGWITRIGLTYVTLRTADGVLQIPNSVMLAAGIGHLDDAPAPSESSDNVTGESDDAPNTQTETP